MFAVTIDVDWAPDWMIEDALDLLESSNAKATVFATHESPILERLRSRSDLFELGIHPNFLPGSSHGSGIDEVFRFLKRIAPEAVSMRTHALYQTTPMLCKASECYGIENDVSLFIPNSNILFKSSFKYQASRLNRLVYNWEDDFEFYAGKPSWKCEDLPPAQGWIFDFHPVHLALNSASDDNYLALRKTSPNPQGWTRELVGKHRNPGEGTKTMFDSVLSMRLNCAKIREIAEKPQMDSLI